jgi:hypothetical protein
MKKVLLFGFVGWVAGVLINVAAFGVPPARITRVVWDEVNQNVDGSSITSMVTYTLYCGAQPRTYGFISPPIMVLNYDLYYVPLPDGTWYCAVTAKTVEGGESDYSEELTVTMSRRHPKPPRNLLLVQ